MPPRVDPEKTDEEVIALYTAGDQEAFKMLINRYISSLYNFAARVGSQNDASDIVSETFIKVWRNLGRYNPEKSSFKTWIFTIARNTSTDFLRKKRSLLFSDIDRLTPHGADAKSDENTFLENIPDEELLPDAAMQKLQDKMEGNKFLNDVLDKLNPDYREILVLHFQEDMTFGEIGKILNKPLNTVKSQYRRALIELRKGV